MAEWLIEQGIGEERAILFGQRRIHAARLRWPGRIAHGAVAEAVVVQRLPGTHSAIVRLPTGQEAFARRLPREQSEGKTVRVLVEREAIAERGRLKRAQVTMTDAPLSPAPTLADSLVAEGESVRIVRRFPSEADWEGLFLEAWSGQVSFDGGTLLFADTPAMTVIDIDGAPPDAIIRPAIAALAAALRRFDVAGNIGVDFPTLSQKDARKAADACLAEVLADWPHERTAMNGFGFVQIVARLQRASLLQMIGGGRIGAATRLLLRRAEAVEGAGETLLTAHPAIIARLKPEWLEDLTRRTGRPIRMQSEPGIAIEGGFAQTVSP